MNSTISSTAPRFRLGRLVATPGAIAAMQRSQQDPLVFLNRHRRGDWGDLDASDKAMNDQAISHESNPERRDRVLSAYHTGAGEKIWIITEQDRSVTTILMPEEY
jgi:hypothetical protein